MRNILFIAIEFPPYQTTGAFRSMYFVKYLNKFNINPIVLTIDPERNNPQFKKLRNDDFEKNIPKDTVVYRTILKSLSTSNNKFIHSFLMYFKVLDRYGKFWSRNVLNILPEIVDTHKPELIYVSCPPFSVGVLAAKISKLYNLPLIVDMRDGWSKWCVSPFASYLHYKLTVNLEKKLFKRATKIITVTPQLGNIFEQSHSFLSKNEIEIIPNGFDFNLDYNRSLNFNGLTGSKRPIVISYIGNFYYNPDQQKALLTPWYKKKGHKKLQYTPVIEDWLYRSPYFFLKSLKTLFSNYPEYRSLIKFQHFGHTEHWLKSMVEGFGLEGVFESMGFFKYNDLQMELSKTDLFLSTSMKVHGGEDYAIGSKSFDYITQYKPILGFVTKGAQRDFIIRSNSGLTFDPDEIETNSEKLLRIFNEGVSLKLNENYLNNFARIKTAKRLAEIIKSI